MVMKHLRNIILSLGISLVTANCLTSQRPMPDTLCEGETGYYYVLPRNGSTYTWYINGEIKPGFISYEFRNTWNYPAAYTIQVREKLTNGCFGELVSGMVYVLPSSRENCLSIPEAFTPNNDGINDYWQISGLIEYPDVKVNIYNRWGQLVWASETGYPKPWDGLTSDKKQVPMGSYHYIIRLRSNSRPRIGTITVLR